MPAQRPRASFEPIPPNFDLKSLVESTPNFQYANRISCATIDEHGQAAFEKLVLLHVIVNGKPLVVDGFEERLKAWTFTPKWLCDNSGDKIEDARNLTAKENLPLTMAHYLKNMGRLANQFFDTPGAYRDKKRQRMYLKDIDCPQVWWDELREQLPPSLAYLNDSTGEVGGRGAVPDPNANASGQKMGRGIAHAGDLMSSLPPDMRAENLMCYIGHEGTYTPAHREMCASLGNNIMVEASNTVSDDGKVEKPGSSIWFMTESKERHLVSEYWLSVLGHDIEVESHFAQVVAWKKAPFNVYVVEQRPGDLILIPPLAPHQVWNRGTRTMKVAWNRTTVETLEMALHEALPRSRIVCRDEQYKNKAIVYYTLQKYYSLLLLALQQATRLPAHAAQELVSDEKFRTLKKDFTRLFKLYRDILLSEMFNPDDREAPKSLEYLPFDSNVTCAYCRCNIFNRFLSCPTCKELLGHHSEEGEGDPYDVCMDCYVMGRSCGCISGLRWVEQFRWKELTGKYDTWRKLIIQLNNGQVTHKPNKTPLPLPLIEERKQYGRKTLAEVCKDQLKRRPWKDVSKQNEPKDDEVSDEEIVVDDNGMVKKVTKKKSKTWLKNNQRCHVCQKSHPTWKMAQCTTCDRWWCYGTLFRGWDKMPLDIMQDPDFKCPHCLGICFAGACKREGRMNPYEPKGTLLGHDTRKVADVRSVEALVDFSISNLPWLKDDDPANRIESRRFKRANAEAQKDKDSEMTANDEDEEVIDETQMEMEYSPTQETPIDPALTGAPATRAGRRRNNDYQISGALQDENADAILACRLQAANSALPPPAAMMAGPPVSTAPDGYAPLSATGFSGQHVHIYPHPENDTSYQYPIDHHEEDGNETANHTLRPFRKRRRSGIDGEDDDEEITLSKMPRAKKPRLAAGFRSSDLAESAIGISASKAKNEAQRQFEKEKERKALEKAKQEGRFISLLAAMKGKKRVVTLRVPGARLAQLLAQQAAKAALSGFYDEDANGEHEVVEGASQHGQTDDQEMTTLLKSDIAVKKQNLDSYQQRLREGKIINSESKKALVPIEEDETFRYKFPGGKRAERRVTWQPTTAASAKGKRAPRNPRMYEEVDVGSDEDEEYGNIDEFAPSNGNAAKRDRRSLPGYLRDRHAGEDDLPDELPDTFRYREPRAAGRSKQRIAAATASMDNIMTAPKTAGKRPSMRPSAVPVDRYEEEEQNVNDMVSAAANGDIFNMGAKPVGSNGTGVSTKARPVASGRPRGRPSKGLGPKPASAKPATPSNLAQENMAEQNRLAKLQALQMVEQGGFGVDQNHANGAFANMDTAQLVSDDDEEEDDDDDDDIRVGVRV